MTFFVVVAVVLVLLSLGVGLALRAPLQRLWFADTGLDDWRAIARQLSWPDRIALARANTRGRATSPRLAGLAVRRGHVMMSILARVQYGRRSRFLYPVLAALGLLQLALNLAIVLGPHGHPINYVVLVVWAVLTPAWAAMPWIHRRRRHRLQRSVDLNARIASDPTSPPVRDVPRGN